MTNSQSLNPATSARMLVRIMFWVGFGILVGIYAFQVFGLLASTNTFRQSVAQINYGHSGAMIGQVITGLVYLGISLLVISVITHIVQTSGKQNLRRNDNS